MINLRRYQVRAVENFKDWVTKPERIGTIILATGVGKTYTASACLKEFDGKILWVAHREELIEQAKNSLANIITDRSICVEMAEQRADANADIVVGSVQTLSRNRKHLEGFEPNIIVIDEYHHYAENNIQYDGLLQRWPNAKVLGLTATPWRASGEPLPLGRTLIQMDIGTAVDKGYLVPPVPETLISQVSLADVKTKMGDFDLKGLAEAVNVDSRNQLIADKIIELVTQRQRQGILFAVNVEHSKAMFNLLKDRVRAAEIYGETPSEQRREIINKIRNGEIDILLNNLVATEGFDVPHLSFVIMARPTRSLGLYIQCIGRGLRTFNNKSDCIIVDVFDKIKAKQNRMTFSDMAKSGDLYGEKKQASSILQSEVKVDPISNKLIHFPVIIKPRQIERWLTDEDTFSISSWAISKYQWVLTWTQEKQIQAQTTKQVWSKFTDLKKCIGSQVKHATFGEGLVKKILEQGDTPKVLVEFGWGDERVILTSHLERKIQIKEDLPGQFEIVKVPKLFYMCMPGEEIKGRFLAFEKSASDLVLTDDKEMTIWEADKYLVELAKADGVFPLVRTGAKWKNDPASDKQLSLIKNISHRINFDLDLTSLTKGDVSSVIEQSKWQTIIIEKFGTDYKNQLLGYDRNLEDV